MLTQERVAFASKITKNYLSDLENGTRNPTYLVLSRILRALGVSWAKFGAALDRQASRGKEE